MSPARFGASKWTHRTSRVITRRAVHSRPAINKTAAILPAGSSDWKEFLPRTKLKPHSKHVFVEQLAGAGPATHVRFNIYPDGGVSRLRIFGQPAQQNRPSGIARLNDLSEAEARKALLDCCGSRKWSKEMLALRPFADANDLLNAAARIWSALRPDDWLDAFRHHPPIGGSAAQKRQSLAARRWSASEQSQAQVSSDRVRTRLAEANQAYFAKFGIVFLICATGKTADEILAILLTRLPNDPDTERRIAAEEQLKITRLRLERFLAS